MQTALTFPTGSPINVDSLSRQNRKLYEALLSGGKLTMLDAVKMGIGTPHSRFADIAKVLAQHGQTLYSRYVRIDGINYKEYSLKPFN